MKKKTSRPSVAKRVLEGMSYAVVVTTACGVGVIGNMMSRSSIVTEGILHPFAILNADPKEVFHSPDGVTLLILGTDDDRQMIGWGVDEHGHQHAVSKVIRRGARADMILVARLDFATHKISGLSIPRDTECRLVSTTRKINAYYSIAPEGKNEEYMVRAVEHTLPGVHIDRTIALNYDAFQGLVDTVGGVPVVVPKGKKGKGLQYDDNAGDLHIHLSPGPQTLDGKDAMGYVRFRHDSESDYGRQQRQKEFLASFKSSVFRHPLQLPEIAEQSKAVMSNALTDKEIIALVAFGRKVPQASIKLGMLPTYPHGNGLRVVESKRDDALREYGLIAPESQTVAVDR